MYVEHNKFIVIKIKYETWIAKQFIATYVRNLNYRTTCFGLWRPSSGQDSGILSIPLATQTHLPLQDTRILTWWPPEAETCRPIIKIPYVSCNKLFSNSCLVFNLNYYKFVVLDVTYSLIQYTFTYSIRQFSLHFPSRASPCAITFQLDSTASCARPHNGRSQELVAPAS